MRSTVIAASELTPSLSGQWEDFLRRSPLHAGPALHPELFRTVGRHFAGTRIAVIEDAGRVAAFLPFERHPWLRSIAGPVPICDYQAMVTDPDCSIGIRQALQSAGLSVWRFDHLLAPASALAGLDASMERESKRIVMPAGFDAYLEELKAGGKSMKNTLTKLKLLVRDHGEAVFHPNLVREAVLDTLLEWKAQRFNAGQPIDKRIQDSLRDILRGRNADFAGVLGGLYAGEKLVAAHFGMKSGGTLYYWFPAFDPAFSKYTPGWLLMYFLLRTAEEVGCSTVDLGPGGEAYKDYFANARMPVATGRLELPGPIGWSGAAYRRMRESLRRQPAARAAAAAWHRLRRGPGAEQ